MFAAAQAVLEHPLTAVCPLVEQCMQEDLQRLQDYHSGRPLSSEGGFRCQQRRLVLPAYAAQSPADAQPLGPVAVPACDQDSGQGRDSGECGSSSGGIGAKGGGQLGAAAEGGVSGLQAQGSAGSSLGRVPSGWLSRSGSSSSAKAGSGWRSYRRRLAPSCKELMYVCDGDRHGVIHYIATGRWCCTHAHACLTRGCDCFTVVPVSWGFDCWCTTSDPNCSAQLGRYHSLLSVKGEIAATSSQLAAACASHELLAARHTYFMYDRQST